MAPSLVRTSGALDLIYDVTRKEAYLTAVRQGRTSTAAARAAGISPGALRTALSKDPDFARRELEARQEAIDAVEDALYRKATGEIPAHEREYHEAEKQRLIRTGAIPDEDQYSTPVPPAPDLKAIQLFLERRAPQRWAPPDPSNPGHGPTTINVQNLITAEGARDFRAELQRRQAEALAPQRAETIPTTVSEPDPAP